jgi:hypothetical protein
MYVYICIFMLVCMCVVCSIFLGFETEYHLYIKHEVLWVETGFILFDFKKRKPLI